jgi:hypothetical protein
MSGFAVMIAEDLAQVEEHPPTKYEALGSKPTKAKINK